MKVLSVILFLIGSVAESLKLYRVHVPHYKLAGESALLECDFDLGKARLYAVKWYKDNEEFFRYVPRFKPPIYTHTVDGVNVDISESDSKGVLLKALDHRSTGVYRCECSAEAPSFLTVHGEGRMTVVHLPKEGPQITGNLEAEYEIGDLLDLNCTSSLSYPPAKISWYINDAPIGDPWVVDSGPVRSHPGNALMSTSLQLRLPLSARHFGSRGSAKVRCVASISTLFWQDGDEKVFGNSKKLLGPTNHHHATSSSNHHAHGERDSFRFDSPSSASSATNARHSYHDSTNNLTPNPFTFNSTALVTVRGNSPTLHIPGQLISILVLTQLWLLSS